LNKKLMKWIAKLKRDWGTTAPRSRGTLFGHLPHILQVPQPSPTKVGLSVSLKVRGTNVPKLIPQGQFVLASSSALNRSKLSDLVHKASQSWINVKALCQISQGQVNGWEPVVKKWLLWMNAEPTTLLLPVIFLIQLWSDRKRKAYFRPQIKSRSTSHLNGSRSGCWCWIPYLWIMSGSWGWQSNEVSIKVLETLDWISLWWMPLWRTSGWKGPCLPIKRSQ
jgi:hypothetical protein